MKLITSFLAFVLTPLVKGSSVVTREGNFAVKYSKPKPFVRLLYLIFYHTTKSPYETVKGMKRAFYLNKVANHVTTFRMKRPIFAKVEAVRVNSDRRAELVKEWIDGMSPRKDYLSTKIFLERLIMSLMNAGLPTWQLRQPNAHEDIRYDVNRQMICIDYESVLPSVFVSIKELWAYARALKFFPLDFVNFDLLYKELEEAKEFGYHDYTNFYDDVTALLNFTEIEPRRNRYLVYVALGITVEAVRLLFFRAIENQSLFIANTASLAISIIVSFVLHEQITWKGREGSTGEKFVRFCQSKGVLWLIKIAAFPLMAVIGMTCPLYSQIAWVLDVVWRVSPALADLLYGLISCGVMQAVVIDFVIGFTVGYFLHDGWSFKKKG